jgi:hypothetical protein
MQHSVFGLTGVVLICYCLLSVKNLCTIEPWLLKMYHCESKEEKKGVLSIAEKN